MNELVSQLLKKNKLHCQKLISQLKTEPEEVVREIPVEVIKEVIKEVPVEVIKEVEVVKEVEIIRNDPELEKKLSYSTMENQQLRDALGASKEALNVSKKNLEIQRSINYELSRAKTLSEMEFNNLKDRFSTLENSFNTLDMENKNAQDKTRDEIKDKEEKISTLMKPVKHVKEQKEEKEQREVKKKLKERLGLSRSGKIISLKK